MRKLIVHGDFRNIRSRRADFVCNNRDMLFSVDELEKPFTYWNQKLFAIESLGSEMWKDIVYFPVICLLSRDLFGLDVKSVNINNKEYKIPFDKKSRPSNKEISKIIESIDLVSNETYVKLLNNYDKNYIPYCIDELFEKKGYAFDRPKLLDMCDEFYSKLPAKDKQKGSYKDVIVKTKKAKRSVVKNKSAI